MLIFLDEAGDTGFKFDKKSSKYFVISLVIFNDYQEANNCDNAISDLRKKICKPENWEFHFAHNSMRMRRIFLNEIKRFNFTYFSVIINKRELIEQNADFDKTLFFNFTCAKVFEMADAHIIDAKVVMDKNSNREFLNVLSGFLKNKLNSIEKKKIRKIKMQDSHKNNLLQLADYIAEISNRLYTNKKEAEEFWQLIRAKEIKMKKMP